MLGSSISINICPKFCRRGFSLLVNCPHSLPFLTVRTTSVRSLRATSQIIVLVFWEKPGSCCYLSFQRLSVEFAQDKHLRKDLKDSRTSFRKRITENRRLVIEIRLECRSSPFSLKQNAFSLLGTLKSRVRCTRFALLFSFFVHNARQKLGTGI